MKVLFDDGTILEVDESKTGWIFTVNNFRHTGKKYSLTKGGRLVLRRVGGEWLRDSRDTEYVERKTAELSN